MGVVIGSCGTLFAIRRGDGRGERKKKKEEFGAAIYLISNTSFFIHVLQYWYTVTDVLSSVAEYNKTEVSVKMQS